MLKRFKQPATGKNNQDIHVGQQRLAKWQAQAPFDEADYLEQRLAVDGLDGDSFAQLLGFSAETLFNNTASPAWFTALDQRLRSEPTIGISDLIASAPEKEVRFLVIAEPLAEASRMRVRQAIHKMQKQYSDQPNGLPFDPATIEAILFNTWVPRFVELIIRTMALELNVARLRQQLVGDSAAARFDSFIALLQTDTMRDQIFAEYPVLARLLVSNFELWANVSCEFLTRLCADWSAIRAAYTPQKELGVVAHLSRAGDTHNHGRAVMVVTFTCGFRTVYKPRSLAIDVHFQALLNWFNGMGFATPFQTLHVLDRETHGWVEFIRHKGCTTEAEMQRFYQRQGAYLALLYAMEATDFHFQNIIAHGEQPILIDLESLFHPQRRNFGAHNTTIDDSMRYTVLNIGLLPRRSWAKDVEDGIDLSGLGAKEGQLTPRPVQYWAGIGTDELRVDRKRMAMSVGLNRPKLNGKDPDVIAYHNDVVSGFSSMYQLIMDNRATFLAQLKRFAAAEIRVIVRPTHLYNLISKEKLSPRPAAQCARPRPLFMTSYGRRLKSRHIFRASSPANAPICGAAIFLCLRTQPNSRHVWDSNGKCIDEIFYEPTFAVVERRIDRLSSADFERQLWLIKACLTSLTMGKASAQMPSYDFTPLSLVPTQADYIDIAKTIGERLATLALTANEHVYWLGVSAVRERFWTLVSLKTEFYGGMAGIAFFLAYLGQTTDEPQFTDLARQTLDSIRHRIDIDPDSMAGIGAFAEWGGLIYTLVHLAALWDDATLLAEATTYAEEIAIRYVDDVGYDVISGSAGAIMSLLSLYRATNDVNILTIAKACGEHLLDHATENEQGLGWSTPISTTPLTGFSHGAAGIAAALFELADVPTMRDLRGLRQMHWGMNARIFRPNITIGQTCVAATIAVA